MLKNLKKPWSWFHIELQVGSRAVIAHRISCTRNTRASSDILVQAHHQTSQIVPSQQLLTASLEHNQVLGPFFSSATSNMHNKTVYESGCGRQIYLHYSKKITIHGIKILLYPKHKLKTRSQENIKHLSIHLTKMNNQRINKKQRKYKTQ